MVRLKLAFVLSIPVLLAILSTAALAATPDRAIGAPGFEAPWIGYFSADHCFYLAVRDPNVEGPFLRKAFGAEVLSKAEEKTSNKQLSDLRKMLLDFTEAAKQEKIVQRELTEIVSSGFAMGVKPEGKGEEPIGLMVVPRSAKLDKFFDWVVAKLRKDQGADAVKDVTIEGMQGVRLAKVGKPKVSAVKADKVILISNREDHLSEVVKLAKSGANPITKLKAYKRARARLLPDAALFVVLNPIPAFDSVKMPQADAEQQKRVAESRKSLEAVDCIMFQLAGGTKSAHLDASIIMDPGSNTAKKLPQIFATKPMKSPKTVSSQAPALVSLIRPPDISAAMGDDATREKVLQQLQTLKGTLQMQTGLEYDKDVAGWWGQEVTVALSMPGSEPPEVAIILESTDPKASQEAINKMVRHVTVTQNREFEERKVGSAMVRVVKPGPQPSQVPMRPTVCAKDNLVMLATGPSVVEAILSTDAKLDKNPGVAALAASLPPDRMTLMLYLKTDLITKLRSVAAQRRGEQPAIPNRFAEEVESLLVGLGMPDGETVQVTVLFNGR